MNQWTIVSRQIGRNGLRSFLMGAGGGLFAAVLVTVTLLGVGINQSIRQTVNRLGADLMVIPQGEEIAAHFNDALVTGRPAAFYLPRALETNLVAHPDIARVSTQTFAQTLTNARCCAGSFFLVGFDRGSDFTVQPWLSDPMLELPDDAMNWILVGDRILLKPGESVDLYGSTFRVAGVLAPTGMGMDWSIYLPHSALDRLVEHSLSAAESPLQIPAHHDARDVEERLEGLVVTLGGSRVIPPEGETHVVAELAPLVGRDRARSLIHATPPAAGAAAMGRPGGRHMLPKVSPGGEPPSARNRSEVATRPFRGRRAGSSREPRAWDPPRAAARSRSRPSRGGRHRRRAGR